MDNYRICAFHWCNNPFLVRGSCGNQGATCNYCNSDFSYLHTRNTVSAWFSSWIVSMRLKSRHLGVEFNISSSDLYLKFPKDHRCPILNTPFKLNSLGLRPTIARIDLNYGYEPWNIQIISKRANCMKSDSSAEEMLSFAKWINKNYGENNE